MENSKIKKIEKRWPQCCGKPMMDVWSYNGEIEKQYWKCAFCKNSYLELNDTQLRTDTELNCCAIYLKETNFKFCPQCGKDLCR